MKRQRCSSIEKEAQVRSSGSLTPVTSYSADEDCLASQESEFCPIPSSIREILNLPGELSARGLLGCCLVRVTQAPDGVQKISFGTIVETEYYSVSDKASHSYNGAKTKRNQPMFSGVGRSYVYKIYGVHHCYNVTAGEPGSAILIRALEPLSGNIPNSTIGPGNLTKSLNISVELNELNSLDPQSAISLHIHPPRRQAGHYVLPLFSEQDMSNEYGDVFEAPKSASLPWQENLCIAASCRIGISKDAHRLWRFYILGSKFVSKQRSSPKRKTPE